jgi:hypothetical protein
MKVDRVALNRIAVGEEHQPLDLYPHILLTFSSQSNSGSELKHQLGY